MLTLLTGENSFMHDRALQRLMAGFDGEVEKIDGSELDLKQLPDLLMGGTLFTDRRLIFVKGLSDNKSLWADFADWLPRLSDDITLILVEPKPDKRTKTFKELQKIATVEDYPAWTERDTGRAEQWVSEEAANLHMTLDKKLAHELVRRVGVDQWQLWSALQKLVVLDAVTEEAIATHVEAQPSENVFNLFEAALQGRGVVVSQMIRTLEQTEDPYRLFGLLGGQAFQFAALAVTDKATNDVAKDIGAHPYALGKLATAAQRAGVSGAKKVLAAFLEADMGMKTSLGEPWLLIERALMKVANRI